MKIKVHKAFQLNNISFKNVEALLQYSKKEIPETTAFLEELFADDKFIKVKTSGSTGKPKVIQIHKKHLLNSAKATGSFFELGAESKAFLCLDTNYIAGKMMLVRALVLGWSLDVLPTTGNPLENNSKSYDFGAMVPLQVQQSIALLHKVKTIIIGGGVVSDTLLKSLQIGSTKFFATYGMTETVTHIALRPLNPFREVYHVLPNVNIETDIRDCLVIDAPIVSDTRVVTNDIVELISDTSFKWLGRFDNVINSGGVKLITEQIESKLGMIIAQRFFVIGQSDEVLGERLVLIVEGARETELEMRIQNFEILGKFEKPKAIYFVNRFVETETKKIQRQKTLDLIINE